MASLLRKIDRFLRSRTVVAWLLVSVTAYAFAVTLVPLGHAEEPRVMEWAQAHPLAERVAQLLGLHHAYTTPLFLLAATMLTLSTTACSIERTRLALRAWRRRGRVDKALVQRVDSSPTFVVAVQQGIERDEVLVRVEAALRRLRMRVRRGPVMVEGRSNMVGSLGSPLFHWALVALFVCAGLGQLTRSEGVLQILIGRTASDVHKDYVYIDEGPWFGERHTGLRLEVRDLQQDIEVGGVLRGPSPDMSLLSREGHLLRRQWVYPNNPLRRGAVTVHMDETGPALQYLLVSEEETTSNTLYFRRSDTATLGVEPLELEFSDGSGRSVPYRLEARQGQKVAVTALGPVKGIQPVQVAGRGESVRLPGSIEFIPVGFEGWVSVVVVNDWSVPFIFATFLLGTLGLALTIFLPPRAVLLRFASSTTAEHAEVRVSVSAHRTDPAFASRVRRELTRALESGAWPEEAPS